MNLDKIFSEEDVLQIVEWAHGRKPGKIFHINLVDLKPEGFNDWPDHQKYTYWERYGNRSQELEVSFNYQGCKDNFANLRLSISNTGQVEYATWSDCGCRIEKPLHIYRLVMQRFEEAGILEEIMEEKEVANNG